MVVYDLICDASHKFEGWFRSSDDFQHQHEQGLVQCPVCESSAVRKLPSASYINTGRHMKDNTSNEQGDTSAPSSTADQGVQATVNRVVLDKLREFIETTTEDVGRQFSEEAKKIHYGEVEKRSIRGEATVEEIVELHEEGIDALPLPLSPIPNKKLN